MRVKEILKFDIFVLPNAFFLCDCKRFKFVSIFAGFIVKVIIVIGTSTITVFFYIGIFS